MEILYFCSKDVVAALLAFPVGTQGNAGGPSLVFWKRTGIYTAQHLVFDPVYAPLYLKWAFLMFPALESIFTAVSKEE